MRACVRVYKCMCACVRVRACMRERMDVYVIGFMCMREL